MRKLGTFRVNNQGEGPEQTLNVCWTGDVKGDGGLTEEWPNEGG